MEDFTKKEKMQQAMRLKHSRQLRGLSIENFSELIGMSPSGYQKVECGKNSVSRKLLKNIWEQFRISPDYILLGERFEIDEIIINIDRCTDEDKMILFLYLHQYFVRKN